MIRLALSDLPLLALGALAACAATTPPPEEPATSDPPRTAVALRLEEAPDELNGGVEMPMSRATLVLIHDAGRTERHGVGTFPGVCTPRPPERGELARVECWWAGAGDHVVVRRGAEHVVVMVIPQDEMSGPGNAEVRARVPLDAEVEVDPVGP